MKAIYKKELCSFYLGPTGYIMGAIILLISGIYVTIINISGKLAGIEYSIQGCLWMLIIVVPLITMRSFVEERRQHTDMLLYTSPVTTGGIAAGKYLANLTMFLAPVAVMALYPLILSAFGTVDFVTAYIAIFGFALLGAALLSIGLFISSLTDSYVVAAIGSVCAGLLMFFMGNLSSAATGSSPVALIIFTVITIAAVALIYGMTKSTVASVVAGCVIELAAVVIFFVAPTLLTAILSDLLSLFKMYDMSANFYLGVIDLSAIVYYGCIIGLFLFMTAQSLERRRWR